MNLKAIFALLYGALILQLANKAAAAAAEYPTVDAYKAAIVVDVNKHIPRFFQPFVDLLVRAPAGDDIPTYYANLAAELGIRLPPVLPTFTPDAASTG